MQIFLSFILGIVTVLSGYGFYTDTTPKEMVEGLGSMMSGSVVRSFTPSGALPTAGDVLVAQSDGTYSPQNIFTTWTPPFENPEMKSIDGSIVAGSTTVIYTTPLDKKAVFHTVTVLNTGTTTSRTYMYVEGSTNTRIVNGVNAAAVGAVSNITFGTPGHILEPGERVSIFSSTTANYYAGLMEIPSTSKFKTIATTTFASSTSNLLYTVPIGKTAIVVGTNSSLSYVAVLNATEATRVVSLYVGNEASSTTMRLAPSNQSSILTNNYLIEKTLTEGESIYIGTNSATAGQAAWVTVYEY